MERVNNVQLRHNIYNNGRTNKESGWKYITGLFIVQFLLTQLFFSYGMYVVYLEQENIPVVDSLWSVIIFVVVYKFLKPWCRDIAETFHEGCFRTTFFFGITNCIIGVSSNYFISSFTFRNIFYGGIAGFGTTLSFCLVESRIFDLYQYQTTLLYTIKHISAVIGLFSVPHAMNFIFNTFGHTKYIFFFHGIILLHAIPASYLFGKSNVKDPKRFSRLSELWINPERRLNETVGISEVSRNWKSPSDNLDKLFENHEDLEHEIPAPHQKCTAGIEVMPEIPEENEEEINDDDNKRNSKLLNDIKRLSVISNKFEVLIDKDKENEEVLKTNNNSIEINKIQENATKFNDRVVKSDKKNNVICCCCCSPYQKFRYRRRIKNLCDCLIGTALKPLIGSCKILLFYPCLLSMIHSMLSPLIFLNIMPIMAKEDSKFGNMTEVSFMLSLTAFAYVCFLITVPWVSAISKRNLKYVYLFGLGISITALYLIRKKSDHDYITVGCLIYGFGMGIEQYCLEIICREYLGVKHWAKAEGTIDSLSGLFLIPIFILINTFIPYNNLTKKVYIYKCFNIIMYSHLIIMGNWMFFPAIDYLIEYRKKQKRKNIRYSFMEHL